MAAAILATVAAVLSIFWGGFVASTLWTWFMVPLGVVAINYWHAVGLAALCSVFLGSRGLASDNDDSNVVKAAFNSAVAAALIPAISLAFGWVAKVNM